MAAPMAETTGMAVRCPHPAGRERPGHVGLRSGSGGHSGRPAGRPGMGRGGRRPRRRGYPQFRSPLITTVNQAAELRLCSNPPQLYAHIVILAAQKAANRHK